MDSLDQKNQRKKIIKIFKNTKYFFKFYFFFKKIACGSSLIFPNQLLYDSHTKKSKDKNEKKKEKSKEIKIEKNNKGK